MTTLPRILLPLALLVLAGCQSAAVQTVPAPHEVPRAKWEAVAAFGRSVRHRFEGDLVAAEKELIVALSFDPTAARVYRELGRVRLLRGDTEGAVPAFEEAVRREPNSVRGLEDLSDAYRRVGRFDAAVVALCGAHELAPERDRPVYRVHALLLFLQDQDRGFDFFSSLVDRRPDWAFAHEGLGDFWMRRGEPTEAAGCYRQAIALEGLTRGLQRKVHLAQEKALIAADAPVAETTDPGVFVPAAPRAAAPAR